MWPKVFSVVVLKLSNQLHSYKENTACSMPMLGIGADEEILRHGLIRIGWRAN